MPLLRLCVQATKEDTGSRLDLTHGCKQSQSAHYPLAAGYLPLSYHPHARGYPDHPSVVAIMAAILW